MSDTSATSSTDTSTDYETAINTGWVLMCAFVIFSMQAGFALLEAGAVRSKNGRNVMIKGAFDACAGALAWWATGYAFAGPWSADISNAYSLNPFIGTTHFFLTANFSNWSNWFFQFTFAATSSTIVNGAMSERTGFGAYLIYTSLSTGFIYPVVAHWVWSGPGWLGNKDGGQLGTPLGSVGVLDFAGAGVVHLVGGTCALVGSIVVGPRVGRFTDEGDVVDIPGHNAIFQGLGAILLWFGFYAFNCGSTLQLTGGFADLAAKVAVNTTLSGASGGLVALVVMRWRVQAFDLNGLLNGFLVGLVAITAGCGYVEPWAAFTTGCIAALGYILVSTVVAKLHVDDPIDAFAVHGMGGIVGLLCAGLFAREEAVEFVTGIDPETWGLVYGGGFTQLGLQLLAVVAISGWSAIMAALTFLGIKYCPGVGLRISPDEECQGLDRSKHGGSAYPELSHLHVAPVPFDSPRRQTSQTNVQLQIQVEAPGEPSFARSDAGSADPLELQARPGSQSAKSLKPGSLKAPGSPSEISAKSLPERSGAGSRRGSRELSRERDETPLIDRSTMQDSSALNVEEPYTRTRTVSFG